MMTSTGTVRQWSDDEGWGVLDAPDVPGGCWAHFSAVALDGYRTLEAGSAVHFDWESVTDQDGYVFRAIRVWPVGTTPVEPQYRAGPSAAYRSELVLTFDEPDATPPGD
jgi:CspA family cold shock protein